MAGVVTASQVRPSQEEQVRLACFHEDREAELSKVSKVDFHRRSAFPSGTIALAIHSSSRRKVAEAYRGFFSWNTIAKIDESNVCFPPRIRCSGPYITRRLHRRKQIIAGPVPPLSSALH
jgi:hypothetical protein